MSLKDNYKYEVELKDGTIITDHNNFNPEEVVRLSFIPNILLLPRHDIIFYGFKFVKRFNRITMGWDSNVKECLLCLVTDKFRLYVKSSNGACLTTHKDYELKL